jgi:hypothetical protein
MVAGRIEALGAPAQLKREFHAASIDDVFVRLARPLTDDPTRRAGPRR